MRHVEVTYVWFGLFFFGAISAAADDREVEAREYSSKIRVVGQPNTLCPNA